ncbi:hypothetical protein ACWD7F_34280, partial [Streptomyces sp. NPDC005122]
MPAAMAAMMGAIPDENAGVGSALDDTVQRAGAAPAGARRSIGDALSVAGRTGDTSLLASAHDAFTSAMRASFLAGAGGVVVAALLAVLLMRDGRAAADGGEKAKVSAPPPLSPAHRPRSLTLSEPAGTAPRPAGPPRRLPPWPAAPAAPRRHTARAYDGC